MVLLNPLAAPFTPSEGLAPPPPWPALSCSSLSPSLPSYTLHDLILAVLTAYKQGLFDAHIASPLRSYANPPPPTVITPSDDPPSLSSPSVADIDSGSAAPLPHPSPSLQQGDVPPTAVPTAAADNPTPPTISPPLDYSCLIDSLSLGKSGYPLVVPSKSRRSSSTRPTVKPCISSGTHRQHNRYRKPGHRSTKSSSESPKKTTIISPTRPRVPSPPIIRPSSPTPIPTHNRFDTIAIPEEENSTDFALAILQPLINQAINDAENKFVVRSVLTDICDRVLSNVVVTVDTPSIHPTPSSITKKHRKNKKKNKEVSVVTSSNALSSTTDICSSPPPPSVPSLVDTNLASILTPIDSNINEAERLSTIVEEKVDLEIEMKENPIIASVQPLSSSQSKKLKKQNKMVKKEVVANRTRNKTRAARRTKKQEKELEGLSHEEIGEKLREILAECAGKKGPRLDDDMDEECVWYDPNCDIAEEDLMEFGNGW